MTRPIVLLTDFGHSSTYAGQVKAVIAGIAPEAPVIDLTHDVAPFAIEEGAWMLECALPVLPEDAVVVAVVDPGVGTQRAEVVIRSGGRLFVGPDNGLLSCAVPRSRREELATPGPAPVAAGTDIDVRELCEPLIRRPHVSATFHGRDIFAPAAAHLARGLDHRLVGPPLPRATVFAPFEGRPGRWGEIHGRVIHVDRYGNIVTTIRAGQVFPQFELRIGGIAVDRHFRTFADAPPGVPFCHVDSSGYIAIALNQEDAARVLGVGRGDPVVVHAR
jgi:S-adenosylmethionine hydrolase